ncbi:MAG: IS1 family transposase [Rhodobacteraceae bacterium]|nr:IS1 family transposase [Paracoccaceae bacterium]
MNPAEIFCPNVKCNASGLIGQGNISVHSWQEGRLACDVCKTTFSETKGTMFYGLKKDHKLVEWVVTLLGHGCPPQAIVAAFGLDERTVADWQRKAGAHCQGVHEHIIGQSQLDVGQVQADEIKVKTQMKIIWIAMAMLVSCRLWLGGTVSARRDRKLIDALVAQVRAIALCRPMVWAVDGLSTYVKAIQRAFRTPLRNGKPGAPRKVAWPDVGIVQVIKRRAKGVLSIERRIRQGDPPQVQQVIDTSQGGRGGINTAFIERLNATFRQCLAALGRRTRHLARTAATLEHGMYLVGCLYNFCWPHQSLRLPLVVNGRGQRRWVRRTPALAAGLTDHIWSVYELLSFKVPPAPFQPQKRRGRPPKRVLLEAAA